ncbi:MAG: aconitate hydratase [Thermaerobacter sp.]|nr:aconitate hydratase [Thermaerobacter sp.]
MGMIESTPEFVAGIYDRLEANLKVVRARLGNRPMSLAEKILLGHLHDPQQQDLTPGKSYLQLHPDRIAMQDATAQMALLQFAHAGRSQSAVPATVHCDHLITARVGAAPDTESAVVSNREVYDFLRSASQKYGLGFWEPGSGIIHQVVLENYAFPGGLMIGTDSHTPNAGGLGMLAVGVGGADAVDVMAGLPWEVLYPKRIGVKLTGTMSGWTSPKDVILAVLGKLTVKGGTNKIVEYFGPGARTISCTGKATITNMGAELGATTSVFPFDDRMATYLRATSRSEQAELAEKHAALLRADAEVEQSPEKYFDELIEIDLATLRPNVTGPHTPDLVRTTAALRAEGEKGTYPVKLSAALIGSCTNSSYEDLTRAADIARQASAHGMKMPIPFLVTPGSEQVRQTVERDGLLDVFAKIGGNVLANACGPCIGQWQRDEVMHVDGGQGTAKGTEKPRNSIITSYNRNFPARNDANPNTFAFISSPEVVVAYGLAGRIDFDPTTDELEAPDGSKFRLEPPKQALDIPAEGFVRSRKGYVAPAEDASKVQLDVSPESERLQLLEPFAAWNGKDYLDLPLLFKAKGKCTTDHISPAGPWLRFRGHLDHISDNMFLGANNAFCEKAGFGSSQLTGKEEQLSKIARDYKEHGLRWVVVADENYGEGSSREHAAMSPRYLGGAAVIARSFARIHESNLKKQGILPLTFANPSDWEKVRQGDRVSILELAELAPGKAVQAVFKHEDGTQDRVELRHSLSEEQIGWFRAGSALNLIAMSA